MLLQPFLISYPYINPLRLKPSQVSSKNEYFCHFMIFQLKNTTDSPCIYLWVYISIYVHMCVWNMSVFFVVFSLKSHSPFNIISSIGYDKKTQISLPTPSNNTLFANVAYTSPLLIAESLTLKDVFQNCNHCLEDEYT